MNLEKFFKDFSYIFIKKLLPESPYACFFFSRGEVEEHLKWAGHESSRNVNS